MQDTLHAFVLRKNVETFSENNNGELEIVSRDLWNLLKNLLSHCPDHTFQGDAVTIFSPYETLIFNWEKLETAAKVVSTDEKDRQARMDLKLLLDTISNGSGDPKLDKYFKIRDSNREQRSVAFDSLWTIFPPGELVYGRPCLGQDQIFIVRDNLRAWPRDESKTATWSLECWTYDWDGKFFKRRLVRLDIESFESYKPIASLAFYPLDHHPDSNLKQRLVDRGYKYKRLCIAKQGSRMFDYAGNALFGKQGFSGISGDDDGVSVSHFLLDSLLIRDKQEDRASYNHDLEYSQRSSPNATLDSDEVASKSAIVSRCSKVSSQSANVSLGK